jgi:hypothetical protein
MSAEEPAVAWERAMLGYDGARILANLEQVLPALDRITTAACRFRSLEAPTEAAIADALHGRLLVNLQRSSEAETVLTAALAGLPQEATGPRGQIEALLSEIRA